MDAIARIQAALESRAASGLQIWFIGPTFGDAVSVACANETDKAGYLAALREKGRVILSENGRAGLASRYVEEIGYDPYEDNPAATDSEIARILVEHFNASQEG